MYPRLFEIPLPFEIGALDSITLYSFGAMVAVAFLVAAWLTGRELDRLHHAGRLPKVRIPVEDDRTDKRTRRRGPRTQEAPPSALLGTITILAIVLGFVGAKLFHILENLDQFWANPGGMLFSSGGFTFFGGLILAALGIVWFVRSKGLPVATTADAFAPGLILAYGIGRIGCYLAGDGDWGVCSSLATKPGWIPGWLWSEQFPNNVMGPAQTPTDVIEYTRRQMVAAGMDPEICAVADGVFPTMLYEFGMAVVLFAILWSLRKHPFLSGWLFALYLVFVGLERFLIEQIRVNNVFDLLSMTVTQAEVVSTLLMLLGLAGLALRSRRRDAIREPAVPSS